MNEDVTYDYAGDNAACEKKLTSNKNIKIHKEDESMSEYVPTSHVIPTVDSYGYGFGGRSGLVEKIQFDQNQQIARDVLGNRCEAEKGVLSVIGNTNLTSAIAEIRAGERFAALNNKVDGLEKAFFNRELQKADKEALMLNTKCLTTEQSLNDFRFPKPSARYEVVGCGNGCNNQAPAQNVNIIDIVNIVKAMTDGGRPGNS